MVQEILKHATKYAVGAEPMHINAKTDTYKLDIKSPVTNDPEVEYTNLEYIEKLIVSGGPDHLSQLKKDTYYMEFIDSALKCAMEEPPVAIFPAKNYSVTNVSTKTVLLVLDLKWKENDLDIILKYEQNNQKPFDLIKIKNKKDFIDYINNGQNGNREEQKIFEFFVFSHGNAEQIWFTYDLEIPKEEHNDINFKTEDIEGLDDNAFDQCNSFLYSCNLGTKSKVNNKYFAQEWSNKTKAMTYAFLGKTLYENLNSFSISPLWDEYNREKYKEKRISETGTTEADIWKKPYPSYRYPTGAFPSLAQFFKPK